MIMATEILASLITSGLGFVGVLVTVLVNAKGTNKTIETQTNLTLYRLEQLEKKQDKHNGLIDRMYKIEERVSVDEEEIKVANHRISDLERNNIH